MVTRAELEQLALEKMALEDPNREVQSGQQIGNPTRAELEALALEKMASEEALQGQVPRVNLSREADLGIINRARYSLEPMETNRRALLVKEYGPQNVQQDPEGNVFIRQGNEFRPVNKPGASVADIADILGSAPEAIGGAVGGLVGGASSAGLAVVPSAIVGGAAGSIARQALSSAVGVPQVATPIERATEVGLSGLFGGAGTAVGVGAKAAIQKAAPFVRKIFPSFKPSKEGMSLIKIAQKEGLPTPTSAQIAGGEDLTYEQILSKRPFFGSSIKKKVDSQVEAIKKNVKDVVGEFVNVDSERELVGNSVKSLATRNVDAVKSTASELFDRVAREGADVSLPSQDVRKSLINNLRGLSLFDEAGQRMSHSSKTGLTETQFSRLQGIFDKVINDRAFIESPRIDANTINTMRKFIDANIKEGSRQGYDDALLIGARESFLDVTEKILERKSPELKKSFVEARGLWRKQIDMNKKIKALGLGEGGLSDEKVISRLFENRNNVIAFKEVTDPETVKQAGLEFIRDAFSKKLGREGQTSADAAFTFIKDKREAIVESIGKESYDRLRNNLFYLKKIGAPFNPSGTAITSLVSEINPKALATGVLQRGFYEARKGARGATEKAFRRSKDLPAIGGASGVAFDREQREGAYKTGGPGR